MTAHRPGAAMRVVRTTARTGAAVVVLGLSLAAPQTMGVAAADSGSADGGSASARPVTSSRTSDGAAQSSASRAARGPSAGLPRRGSQSAADRGSDQPVAAVAEGSTAEMPDVVADVGSAGESRRRVGESGSDAVADAAEATARPAASDTSRPDRTLRAQITESATVAVAPVAAAPAETVSVTETFAAAAVPAAATDYAATAGPAAADIAEDRGPQGRALEALQTTLHTSIPPQAARANAIVDLNTAVTRWFDDTASWLGGLPATPVSEFLSGALLLVRRTLFNQLPSVSPYHFATRESGAIVGSVGALDPEGDELSYVLSQAPSHGTVDITSDGIYTYTPGPDWDGLYDSFAITVQDRGFNVLDPFGTRSTETVVEVPYWSLGGIGTITKRIKNDTGMPLVVSYYGPRYQGSYNGIVSGPPDNFVLQPGDHASYETEWNIFSGDAYDVVMQWQAPADGPLQYLWTVHYQYVGTGESNLLSCELSSQPCRVAEPDNGRALALLPPAPLATSSPPVSAVNEATIRYVDNDIQTDYIPWQGTNTVRGSAPTTT